MSAPVVVVGAGPVGLVAAVLLTQRGIACHVVERHSAPHPLPRAVHLDGAAVRVLQEAGVAEEFARISRPAAGLRLLDARHRPFAVVERPVLGPDGHPASSLFDQPALEAVLLARLARCPRVELERGSEVTDVDATGVTLRDVRTGSARRRPAAVVLGCDGAGSTVGSLIDAGWHELGEPQRWFVVDVRCARPLPNWGGIDQVCDPRRAATFLHIVDDRYRFEFRMLDGETEVDLERLTAPWLGGLPEGSWTVVRSAAYTFRAGTALRWRRSRTLLLGDAAHLTPPFIGQGLGLGIGDAHGAAWRVAALVRGDADEEVLDEYARERAAHARAVIKTALRVGHAMTGGNGAAAAVRRHLSAALLRIPVVRAQAEATTTVRYARRRGLTGTACPQPLVRHGGRVQPLDDVLGPGFALLHTGPVDPDLLSRAHHLRAHRINLDGTLDDGTLRAWLRRGRARAVLLRPDRVVLATGR